MSPLPVAPSDLFRDVPRSSLFTLKGRKCWGRVTSVYDGDTITCIACIDSEEVAGTPPTFHELKLRLQGIDTPEMRSRNPAEKQAAIAARDRLASLLIPSLPFMQSPSWTSAMKAYLNANVVCAWLELGGRDKYGRVLARIMTAPDAEMSINDILLAEGHARPYDGRARACKIITDHRHSLTIAVST